MEDCLRNSLVSTQREGTFLSNVKYVSCPSSIFNFPDTRVSTVQGVQLLQKPFCPGLKFESLTPARGYYLYHKDLAWSTGVTVTVG